MSFPDSAVDDRERGVVVQKALLAGLVGIIVFLVTVLPVGRPDPTTGERARVITEVSDFVSDQLS